MHNRAKLSDPDLQRSKDQKFVYKFDAETGILYKYYYGEISIYDITSSWNEAFSKNLIPKETKGFILDYQGASFHFKIEEHIKIAEFYRSNLEVFGGFKIAIITTNPKDVIVPTMVEKKDNGYFSKPFSTLPAAIGWVLS